jgi:hypothetical protein
MIVSILTSFLLISRTLYNILAITIEDLNLPDFGFDWINVTDQVKKIILINEKLSFIPFWTLF